MDANLKQFFDAKKSLITDTKIPAMHKQKTATPKPPKGMAEALDQDPFIRFAKSAIKEKPSKKDLIEKMEAFIAAEEAKL